MFTVLIATAEASAHATVTALDPHAPPLPSSSQTTLQTPALAEKNKAEKLPNLEDNDKLWALLQYEAKFGKIEYTSLRKYGDFSHTNLRGVKAVGFNLANFNFKNADLRGADLRETDLHGANFAGADLRGVVLLSAKTEGAYFDQKTQFPYSQKEAIQRGWKENQR